MVHILYIFFKLNTSNYLAAHIMHYNNLPHVYANGCILLFFSLAMSPLLWHLILDQLQERILPQLQEPILPLLESPLVHLHLTEVLILELCLLLLDFTRDHMLHPSHLTHNHTQHIQDQILATNMW